MEDLMFIIVEMAYTLTLRKINVFIPRITPVICEKLRWYFLNNEIMEYVFTKWNVSFFCNKRAFWYLLCLLAKSINMT